MSTLAFLRVSHSMNLNLLDLLVLYEVRRINGCRMADVSRSFDGRSKAYTYAAVNRLADKDMLDLGQLRPGKHTRLSLTAAGSKVLNELEQLNHAEAVFSCGCRDGSNFQGTVARVEGIPGEDLPEATVPRRQAAQ